MGKEYSESEQREFDKQLALLLSEKLRSNYKKQYQKGYSQGRKAGEKLSDEVFLALCKAHYHQLGNISSSLVDSPPAAIEAVGFVYGVIDFSLAKVTASDAITACFRKLLLGVCRKLHRINANIFSHMERRLTNPKKFLHNNDEELLKRYEVLKNTLWIYYSNSLKSSF